MYEKENNINFIHITMAVVAVWIALGRLGFDPWHDWLRYKWLALCEATNAFGVMLYNFLEWLLKALLIGGAVCVALYGAFLLTKFIYDVTWKQLDQHKHSLIALRERIARLEGRVGTLRSEVLEANRQYKPDIKALMETSEKLKDFTGLKAHEEAEKLRASFMQENKKENKGGAHE